jgi:hypothetical protein
MRRSLLLAVGLVGLLTSAVQADNFGFSISSGYGGYGHHHHGCYGPGWGPSWGFSYWAPPPPRYVYVAPPPVVQYVPSPPVIQQPVIIQQQQPYSATTAPASNVAANHLPSPPTRAVANGSPVVIRNTSGKGVPVAYLVDEKSEELRDGQTRTYSGSSHIVEFDRGGDLGTARYELTSGLYTFAIGDNGWELVKDSSSTTTRTADRPPALRRNELPIRQ